MNPNLSQPDFFVPPAYQQLAATHWEVHMLSDPHCLEFIEAIASILVHLQQRENPPGEVPCGVEH